MWLAVGILVLPGVIAISSRLLDVRFRFKAFAWASSASLVAIGVVILGLLRDFPAFAFVGGCVMSAVATAAYALGTSRGLEAWRDANGP